MGHILIFNKICAIMDKNYKEIIMNTNNKKEEILPFRSNDKLKEQERKKKESISLYWFLISLIFSIIMFFVSFTLEDGSVEMYMCGGLLILGIISFLASIAVGQKYIKTDNVIISKKTNDLYVTCPYCKSVNISKISTLGRGMSISIFGLASGKIGKQWKCNNCKSNF